MRNKLFNVVPSLNPRRNVFDLSHERKMSLGFGRLYPIFCESVIPSDEFRVRSECLIRMHPTLAPLMHQIDVYTHYFYVPYRIIWNDFDKFITGGLDGEDTTPHPQFTVNSGTWGNFTKGRLGDYLGVNPCLASPGSDFYLNPLPFRAYQQIWNDYYMDENHTAPIGFSKGNTVTPEDYPLLTAIRYRAWQKDYFTSALSDTQKGPEVVIPTDINYRKPSDLRNVSDGQLVSSQQALNVGDNGKLEGGGDNNLYMDNLENIGITINDLRKSKKLQEYLERNARGGTRLYEWLLSHFSVKSDDLRIGRAQYLGGGKQPVSISEVLSNFSSDTIPQGEMTGHAISVGATNQFKKFFKEYGVVLGLMSILPKRAYMNGMDRMFYKWSKFDYPMPEFAQLGEQPVYNFEIFNDWGDVTGLDTQVWGYQSRFAEFKFRNDSVHGDFRDNLSFWHMADDFASKPPLNGNFLACDTSRIENRIFPVSDYSASDKLYAQVYNKVTAIRPLPKFGTPSF